MAKVLIIVKSYLTHDRQNALCIERVSNCLKIMGHEIDYLSWEQNDDNIGGDSVYTVFEPEYVHGIGNLIRKATKFINTPLNSMSLVNRMYIKLQELIKEHHYTTIIAVINPSEGAEALYRVKKKNPNINAILYEIDPNSNRYKTCNKLIEKIWRNRSIIWEKKIYGSFDHIIHMTSHKKHYSSSIFSRYSKKTIYLDIPNFAPELKMNPHTMHSPLRLLYCGAFYPVMREPYYMLKLFGKVNEIIPLSLDIYTGNSMRKELETERDKLSYMSLYSEVSQKELDSIISESDILISIGNKDSDFLPSKTLMYMSTGKPIIHFYFDDSDVSLRYFRHYPAILNIQQDEQKSSESVNSVLEFLSRVNKGISVDQECMKKHLINNTPEYSAQKISELIT